MKSLNMVLIVTLMNIVFLLSSNTFASDSILTADAAGSQCVHIAKSKNAFYKGINFRLHSQWSSSDKYMKYVFNVTETGKTYNCFVTIVNRVKYRGPGDPCLETDFRCYDPNQKREPSWW